MMRIIRGIFSLTIFLLCSVSFLSADNGEDPALYIEGLENLIDENREAAVTSFSLFIDQYPNSLYSRSAGHYLDELLHKKDNSGIVTFYLGNLATATYTAMRLPELFDYELDSVLAGVTGLVGVGTGLGSSWLMSRDYPISSASDWWIETTELISLGNYLYSMAILEPRDRWGYEFGNKFELGANLVTLLASRGLGYYLFREDPPPKGKGSFVLQSYLWSNFYYILFTLGILEVDDFQAMAVGGAVVSDLAAYAGYVGWDKLSWSTLRTGLVTVGGVGGALIGVFSNMILAEFTDLDDRLSIGIVMATALAGQAVTVKFTRSLEPDKSAVVKKGAHLSIAPVLTPESAGFSASLGF